MEERDKQFWKRDRHDEIKEAHFQMEEVDVCFHGIGRADLGIGRGSFCAGIFGCEWGGGVNS